MDSSIVLSSIVLYNEQLLVLIFSYLNPPLELFKVTECCKLWHQTIQYYGREVWSLYIQSVWKSYQFNIPYDFITTTATTPPLGIMTVNTIIDRLTDIL